MADQADLPGWQNSRWGMLANEVVQAVGAERVKRTPRQKYQHFYSDMKVANLVVGQLAFDVIFQMDEQTHRLRQVLIMHQCDPSRAPTQEADTTRAVLEERLGKPVQIEKRDTLFWVFPTTTMALDSFWIAGSMSAVCVRYFPTGDDTAAPAQAA